MLVFLHKNDKWLKVDSQALYNFTKWVAQSPAELKDATVAGIEDFIRKYLTRLSR